MKRLFIVSFLLICFTSIAFMPPPRKLEVHLIGDSTMSEKRIQTYPETGWGMMFSTFFDTTTTIVFNHAQNGRSTKSFLIEKRWTPIVDRLQKGDIVLIQFGHNDEIQTKKSATTEEEFQKNLLLYVTDTRSKGAIPVLITPAARRTWDSTGTLKDTHLVYAELVRKVARLNNVPLIELDKKSQALIRSFGRENSKLLFNHLNPGEHPNYPEGIQDNTHFNELGARKMAEIVYAEIKELNPGNISAYFYKPVPKK